MIVSGKRQPLSYWRASRQRNDSPHDNPWLLLGAHYLMDGVPRRQGDLAALWAVARDLGVPADLVHPLDRAARRMPWPLAVLLPLAHASKANGIPIRLVRDTPYEQIARTSEVTEQEGVCSKN